MQRFAAIEFNWNTIMADKKFLTIFLVGKENYILEENAE